MPKLPSYDATQNITSRSPNVLKSMETETQMGRDLVGIGQAGQQIAATLQAAENRAVLTSKKNNLDLKTADILTRVQSDNELIDKDGRLNSQKISKYYGELDSLKGESLTGFTDNTAREAFRPDVNRSVLEARIKFDKTVRDKAIDSHEAKRLLRGNINKDKYLLTGDPTYKHEQLNEITADLNIGYIDQKTAMTEGISVKRWDEDLVERDIQTEPLLAKKRLEIAGEENGGYDISEDKRTFYLKAVRRALKQQSLDLKDELNTRLVNEELTVNEIEAANIPVEDGGIGGTGAKTLLKALETSYKNRLNNLPIDEMSDRDYKLSSKYISLVDAMVHEKTDNYKAKDLLIEALSDSVLSTEEARKLMAIRDNLEDQKFNAKTDILSNSLKRIKSFMGANNPDTRALKVEFRRLINEAPKGNIEGATDEILRNQHNSLYPEDHLKGDERPDDLSRERNIIFRSAKTVLDQYVDFQKGQLRIAKGIAAGAVSTVEGAGASLESMGQRGTAMFISPTLGIKVGDKTIAEHIGSSISNMAGKARVALTPEDPTFADKLAQGVGSMSTFFIPGLGIAKGMRMMTVAPRIANWIGITASSFMEASVEGGFAYKEAIERGVPQKEAGDLGSAVFWVNVPMLAVTNRLGVFGDSGPTVARMLKTGAFEGTQELSQEAIGNIAANDPLLANTLDSFMIGFIVGGGTSVISGNAMKDLAPLEEAKVQLDKIKGIDLKSEAGFAINPFAGELFGEKISNEDVFTFQNEGAEKIIHKTTLEEGQRYKTVLMHSGDVLRGLSEGRGVTGYVSEKLDSIEKFIDKGSPELGGVISSQSAEQIRQKAVKSKVVGFVKGKDVESGQFSNELDELKRLWEKQPVVDELQEKARQLNIKLIEGDFTAAKSLIQDIRDAKVDSQQIEDISVGDIVEYQEPGGQFYSGKVRSIKGNKLMVFDSSKNRTVPLIKGLVTKTKKRGMLGSESGFAILPIPSIDPKLAKSMGQFTDASIVPLSTRLARISETLRDALRKFEFATGVKTREDIQKARTFMEGMSKLNTSDMKALDFALKNRDVETVEEIVNRTGLAEAYQNVREVLDDLYSRAQAAGVDVSYLDDYFPRRVIDVEEYLNFLRGTKDWSAIQRAIREEEAKTDERMNDDEKVEFISKLLRGYGESQIRIGGVGNIKGRKINVISEEMNQYYKNSPTALQEYIVAMNNLIESKNFFGMGEDIEKGIANYVAELVDNEMIDHSQEREVADILRARFQNRGARGIWSFYKNLGYIYTMGSPISAITQIGDLAFALYENGFYSTFKGIQKAFGKDKVTKQDLGIDNIIQEFSDQTKLGKAVDTVFRAVGLEAIDNVGKEALINGALDKMSKQAQANDKELIAELDRVFGDEAPQVLEDLKNQDPTTNVKYMLFSRLLKYQPVAMSEMPQYYVEGGNLRVFYMLKSYTIKQLDVYHNEIIRKMKTNPVEAMGNMVRLSMALAVMNGTADVIKDILLGRKIDLGDLAVDNMLRLFGFSKFTIYRAKSEGLASAFRSTLLPPIPFVDDLYRDLTATDRAIEDYRVWKAIPFVGKLYYWWFGGGSKIKDKEDSRKPLGRSSGGSKKRKKLGN